MIKIRSYIIAITILLALMLQIMPMPIVLHQYRPDWVFMVLAYWTLALPNRVNIGIAFINGLALDILLGTTLGVHSFALSATIFVLACELSTAAQLFCLATSFYYWHLSCVLSFV